MCGINIDGVIGHKITYNGDEFKVFIETNLIEYFQSHRDSILIMDNCKFHHRQDVIRLLNEQRINYRFLPAYCPQLNPIEEFFGVLKANYNALDPDLLQ